MRWITPSASHLRARTGRYPTELSDGELLPFRSALEIAWNSAPSRSRSDETLVCFLFPSLSDSKRVHHPEHFAQEHYCPAVAEAAPPSPSSAGLGGWRFILLGSSSGFLLRRLLCLPRRG